MVCPLCGTIIPLKRQTVSSYEKDSAPGKNGHVLRGQNPDLREKEYALRGQNPDLQKKEYVLRGQNPDLQETNPYICADCYKKLVFPEEPRCLKCSRPVMEKTDEYCRDCATGIRHFDYGKALLIHDESAKKILYDLKYRNRRDNAKMLGLEAAERLHGFVKRCDPDVVIPVPLHRKRELARGYNQAELLARRLIRELKDRGLSLTMDADYLIRSRMTSAQKELTREQRRANIRGAFTISPKEDPAKYKGRTVLLIDDIYTSGATLSECARVLKAAGVRKVYFLTFSIG